MTQVSDERLAEMQQACGTPHPPTQETYWYRLAVSGEESPHALDWEDKPHRLVFGLCRIIEKEAALRSQLEPAGVRGLEIAARNLIAARMDTYKARNGRMMSIEADDGEKCWIVHFDEMHELECALSALTEQKEEAE